MAGYGQGTYGAGNFGVELIRKVTSIIRRGNLLVQRKAGRTAIVRRGRGRR